MRVGVWVSAYRDLFFQHWCHHGIKFILHTYDNQRLALRHTKFQLLSEFRVGEG